MPRQHTPEEMAAFDKAMDEAQPLFKDFQKSKQELAHQWDPELALLESRTEPETADIDLGDGQIIKIKQRLSYRDSMRFSYLQGELSRKGKILERNRQGVSIRGIVAHVLRSVTGYPRPITDQLDDITFEIIELVTANPFITKEYLRNNTDKFTGEDLMKVINGYYENQVRLIREKFTELKRIENFRPEQSGTGLR